MKKLHRTSAEIQRQITEFEAVMSPLNAPLPDDFASQAQMLSDRWHLEDLRRELLAALGSERGQAPRKASKKTRVAVAT